jgi:carboxyl-terminal processing protease
MMKALRSILFGRLLVISLLFSLFFGLQQAAGFLDSGDYESNRAGLLGFVLRNDLETFHFSHKEVDESLSKAAFTLYLKQLDSQKSFLMAEDVDKLNAYSGLIGYELKSGKIELPGKAAEILTVRVEQVRRIVKEILSKDFDFSKDESIETDFEKLDYCKTVGELKERWKKILKFQVLSRYLTLMENESVPATAGDPEKSRKDSPENSQASIRKKVEKNYEELFTRMLQEKKRERFDRYFGAVARAFDPHTNYMPPENKEDFDISMRGSLEGIGATLEEEDSYIKVVNIVPGGPAFRQGQLHAGDLILKIGEGNSDPVDITDMRVKDAVRLIRGRKGTEVRLTVKKPEGQVVIPIMRDVVQMEETFVKGTTLKNEKTGKVFGYIKIPSFYRDFEKTRLGGPGRNCTDDVRAELKKISSQKMSGLILDLRNNGGGALADAVKIAGIFIKAGPVVQVKNSLGKIEVLSDTDAEMHYKGPLVVLVNKFSASASEILAAALQDYGRAVIVGGAHTHGKGTVQSIIDLNEDVPSKNMDKYRTLGSLKITVQKFYRISGESTQYKGVVPDIVLPDKFDSIKSSEEFLEYALPWDTVPPAQYTKNPKFKRDIPDLRARSYKRVEGDKDFATIIVESRKIADQQKKTIRSLNLDIARKEHSEAKVQKDMTVEGLHGEGKEKKTPQTEEEKIELLTKEASKDAYVREGISVLQDIISANPDLSLNQVHRAGLIPSLAERLIPARDPLF